MDCVLKAQLIRLLAFKLPAVSPGDAVVTADVDAFVMSPDIAKPITVRKERKMWIYRYELTLGTGYTFMMPFIGGRAHVWEEILVGFRILILKKYLSSSCFKFKMVLLLLLLVELRLVPPVAVV